MRTTYLSSQKIGLDPYFRAVTVGWLIAFSVGWAGTRGRPPEAVAALARTNP